MNGDIEVEAIRPRPLSAGLWTIFSWLRRSERSSSSESISSVGSDRTAASFDFLSPIYYPSSHAPIIRPPNLPTDSYKKRVHERNLRRQRDRGITLHQKYGLWREEGGFDGYSLPPANKDSSDLGGNNSQRCRRAASECFHRRAAYVPGKRRAPPPPTFVTTSLPRSYKRKRQAPKPPLKAIAENKDNIKINYNNQSLQNSLASSSDNSSKFDDKFNYQTTSNDNCSKIILIPCQISKASDKPRKEVKLKSEKSFLKQIFENKKRHSADISHVKLLPNISELDKQAAEIIENNKLLRKHDTDFNLDDSKFINEERTSKFSPGTMWMCTKCLRKYNMTIKSCVYCVPKENADLKKNLNTPFKASSSSTQTESNCQVSKDIEEKKKLREILKEMKDSLPKKSSQKRIKNAINIEFNNQSNETPTLRIGSTIHEKKETPHQDKSHNIKIKESAQTTFSSENNSHVDEIANNATKATTEGSLIRDIIISNNLRKPLRERVEGAAEKKIKMVERTSSYSSINKDKKQEVKLSDGPIFKNNDLNESNNSTAITTHTPLSISSLLNPIYQPPKPETQQCFHVTSTRNNETKYVVKEVLLNKDATSTSIKSSRKDSPEKVIDKTNIKNLDLKEPSPPNPSSNKIKLDTRTVSQIIKKSIEEKQKLLQVNEAKIDAVKNSDHNCDHIKRRKLINQLESSIAKGDEKAAAEAAAHLAKLRLSCSVLSFSSQIVAGPSTSGVNISKQETNLKKADNNEPQEIKEVKEIKFENNQVENVNNANDTEKEIIQKIESQNNKTNDVISIEVWIEDKVAARGPVRLNISLHSTVADLKKEAALYLGIEMRLQRWIVGKNLCNDDNVPIVSLAGAMFDAPFYLCLVESDENKTKNVASNIEGKTGEFYTELIKLEQQALVPNSENFECGVCIEECAVGNGVVLRECLHTFCRECLSDALRHCEEPIISCPAVGCPGVLQDREIRALLSEEDYEKWLARGLAVAESGTRNTFHCRTTDCSGWAFCETGVRVFPCPVCKKKNCIPCQAVHESETCEQYQKKLREITAAENTDEGTQALLDSLISRGEALKCPECQAIITKKWGCDWVKCSACKTEICWVTKGRRWGPAGRGDISGGCKCGVDGKRCHPTCAYCH